MEQKKILVCSHWLELGGAECALLGLLEQLRTTGHQIDLYLCRHSGPLMQYIPTGVNLLHEDPRAASIAIGMGSAVRRKALSVVRGRLFGKIAAKCYTFRRHNAADSNVAVEYSHRFTWRYVRPINPGCTYDLVLSFLAPHYIAAHRACGRKKIAWIHTDYHSIQIDPRTEQKIWSEFDHIAGVSEQCVDSFSEVFPALSDRLLLAENILPVQMIRRRACSNAEALPTGGIRLLSIGRYCSAKNFDNVPDICSRLIRSGLDVYWYIIGFGGDETLIRQKIKEAGMEARVILLGRKDNPYPYLASCDLYVQPSRYEGKCVTVREAQMLGKPVVITRYATSASQLEEGVDGIIVPLDNEGCAAGIAALLRDPEKMAALAHRCRQRDYTNASEAGKILALMEN